MRIKNAGGERQGNGSEEGMKEDINIVKELAIDGTAEYKDMVRMSHADFQRVLCYIEQDITRNKSLVGIKLFLRKKD